MAIITKPVEGILKGVPAIFTLNKSQVLALPLVSGDDYFSNSDNWERIILKYKSSEGKQQELVAFDTSLESPTGFFLISEKARGLFEIQSLKIVDFDGDVFVVPRSALNVADFDVVLLTAPSSLSYSTPVTYTQNTAITNNVPTVTGTVTSYSILPVLPAGLNFNTTTGVISGTPTAASAAANYVVTASNGAGSTTATINITVESSIPENLVTFTGRNNSTYISFPAPGSVTRLLPAVNLAGNGQGSFWSTTPLTGDFTFTATVKAGSVSDGAVQALFGLNDVMPPPSNSGYGLKAAGWGLNFYSDGSIVKPWDVASNTLSYTKGSTYNIEIKRVSGVVSYKVNSTTFSYTLSMSATVYLVGYLQVGSWEVTNAQLVTPTSDYITWDLLTGYQAGSLTITPTSGVSGGISLSGNDVAVKSNADKATGDFDYTFKFDWSAATSVAHMFAGVTGNNITAGISPSFYPNLTCIYGNGNNPDTAYLWHNGSSVGGTTQTLLSGVNTYRLKRVGTTITHYLNDVQIYSATSTSFTAYPSVRTMGNSVVTESYITEASEFTSTYIDWTERAGYTTQVDGGLTSTVTTNFNWDSSTLIYADNSVKNPSTGEFSIVYKLNKQDFNTSDFRFLGYTDLGKTKVGGFYKDNNVASNRIRLIAESLPLGSDIDLSAIYSNSNITTLELKITINSNSTKFFVNGILYGTRTGSFTGNTTGIIPTARVISGMELLESSIIDPVAQPVTWNVAGKTGTGTVTTGADGLITKATGGNGYNVNVLSNEVTTGDGYIQFVYSSIFLNTVFGFGEINSSTGSFDQIIYGTYVAGPNSYETVVNGILTGNTGVTVASGDVVRIQRTGTTFSILRNGSVINTVTINNTNPLKASISIFAQTYGVNNVTLSE